MRGQIQGFFDVPVDHLFGASILAKYINEKILKMLLLYLQILAVLQELVIWLTALVHRLQSLRKNALNQVWLKL